ncbi:related to nucleoporin [Rhynchosporium agropyri]|uniref:Related to nucleoporin n=1 Tax=Rhynchosporium agropyri TaxID=914238 RepID=A0A1E1KZP6_9HELO|nr:related to nucleoporin [Rhynchosporium agropyri]
MSPTSAAHESPRKSSEHNVSIISNPESMESNHDLPARTMVMAEDERHEHKHSDAHKDDPATMAASEELKHTTISDNTVVTNFRVQEPAGVSMGEDKVMWETSKAETPELESAEVQDEEMRERLSSPKKKRGRDQEDDTKDNGEENVDEPGSSVDGSVGNGSRTTRSEPEKKRPRDTSEELPKSAESLKDVKQPECADSKTPDEEAGPPLQEVSANKLIDKSNTSSSVFAGSGFASLAASSNSPFGSLGATKPSIFSGAAQPATSGFGALAAEKPPISTAPAASGFGGLTSSDKSSTAGFGFGSGATSGFGGLASSSVFGSKIGNGFAGGVGPKLSSFAAPGKENVPGQDKPAKAFGAPDSDEDADSNEAESDGEGAFEDEEAGFSPVEEKKKSKSTKVTIDDGEAGEATLLQLRAKIFAIESKETGWKERGVGTLKINVPSPCVSFDDNGAAIPGSFDASGLEDGDADGPRVPRLIMRQENTHRVILNTIIVRAMEFTDKAGTSTAQIMFTAFEGEKESKPINMILKMSEANARLFHAEIASIQREL